MTLGLSAATTRRRRQNGRSAIERCDSPGVAIFSGATGKNGSPAWMVTMPTLLTGKNTGKSYTTYKRI
jgi:hypothetical protein